MTPDPSGALQPRRVPRPARRLPRVPRPRQGLVPRPRLVARLTAAADVPIVLLTAPAGYGKTALLCEWAAHDPRPFDWIDVGAARADLGAALAEHEGTRRPRVLVVDDAEMLDAEDAPRMLTAFGSALPARSTVALASRRPTGLPVGRLRAHGLAVEIRARDLAMTRLEAALLLDAAGMRLDATQVDALVRRTAGWAALLALAAQVAAEDEAPGAEAGAFASGDRLVSDYLRTEVLSELSGDELTFLRRTSMLPELSAPLCDAVLAARGSAARLDELLSTGVPIDAQDRAATSLRVNPALRGLLLRDLRRLEGDLEPALRRRASAWYRDRGEMPLAVHHALRAGDRGRAARLLWSIAPAYAARGRAPELDEWLSAFPSRDLAVAPGLALTGAVRELAAGQRDRAELLVDAAERAATRHGRCADPAPPMLRACLCRHGVRRMREDAGQACARLDPGSPWRAVGELLDGVARHLEGDDCGALTVLELAARRAPADAPLVMSVCHAQLALIAGEQDPDGRRGDIAGALELVAPKTPLRALPVAVVAALAAARGDVVTARRHAAAADALLVPLARFVPWYVAEAQIWLARAHIRLSDAPAARRLLTTAARHTALVPDAPVLAGWLHETWERADEFAAGAYGGGPALTTAELRVLRLLPSHLSFREIGARLHVSSNTVKTQALSIYRKLDVCSRSDAVTRGRAIGLIAG